MTDQCWRKLASQARTRGNVFERLAHCCFRLRLPSTVNSPITALVFRPREAESWLMEPCSVVACTCSPRYGPPPLPPALAVSGGCGLCTKRTRFNVPFTFTQLFLCRKSSDVGRRRWLAVKRGAHSVREVIVWSSLPVQNLLCFILFSAYKRDKFTRWSSTKCCLDSARGFSPRKMSTPLPSLSFRLRLNFSLS